MERKPNGYWTKERCAEEALKYETISEFNKKSRGACKSARIKNWLDEICQHMISPQKPSGYWTYVACKTEALKYESRGKLQINSGGAYNVAKKNNWLDEICSHMLQTQKLPNYWTKERCHEEALKYESRKELKIKSGGAYKAAQRNGWLDDICSHMIQYQKSSNYWTKEKCTEEALKYKTRTIFNNNSIGAYMSASKNNWLDEICTHMKTQGSKYKRCIYVYEFSDNHAYIGLTYNFDNRHYRHITDLRSIVYIHSYKTKIEPIRKQLTEYIEVNEAIKMEAYYVNFYKENGWNILNKAKTGAIGGNVIKWTKEKCKNEALKYNSRTEFQKKSGSSYTSALKNSWLDEICLHMIKNKKV